MENHGHTLVEDSDDAKLVVNFFPSDAPRPFRRKAQAVFLTSVTRVDEPLENPIQEGYPILIRSLANLVITLENGGPEEDPDVHFLTPEQGHYVVSGNHGKSASQSHGSFIAGNGDEAQVGIIIDKHTTATTAVRGRIDSLARHR
jgi:hypothetical protein